MRSAPTNLVTRLNHGLRSGRQPHRRTSTRFFNGVGVNPASPDIEKELRRFAWKAEAGARFAMTQPVFDLRQLEAFLPRVEQYGVPVIAGIWPLISLRNAEFLANEVPGITVPQEVLTRMRRASEKGKEAGLAEGVAIAREMLAAVRGVVRGAQVSAPLGKVDVALEVLRTVMGATVRHLRESPAAFAAITLACLIWGSGFLFGKLAQAELGVGHMMLYRFAFASVGFLPFLIRDKARRSIVPTGARCSSRHSSACRSSS